MDVYIDVWMYIWMYIWMDTYKRMNGCMFISINE